jgi:hypothetical protein
MVAITLLQLCYYETKIAITYPNCRIHTPFIHRECCNFVRLYYKFINHGKSIDLPELSGQDRRSL